MIEALLIILASSTTLTAAEGGCDKDTDCRGDRICVQGECRDAGTISAGTAEPASGGDRLASVKDSMVGLQLDLGGALFYGPSVALEVGSRAAFEVHVRSVALGLVRRLIAGNNSVSGTDFGLGGALRFYFGKKANRQGLFVGGAAEYISASEEEGDQLPTGTSKVTYDTTALVMGANVGYRWVFAGGATLGLGGTVGYYHVLDKSTKYVGRTLSDWYNEASDMPVGLLSLEVGFNL
jgi:hypothetical protein